MIEHRLIERMIGVMERHGRALAAGGRPDSVLLDSVIDFMRSYADECHHGKEEDLLFAKLRSKRMSPEMTAAMDHLVHDHVRARSLVSKLKELNDLYRHGDLNVAAGIADTLAELVRLYPDHIRREDREFFPQAMRYLQRDEADQMLEEFQEFDRKLIHQKYVTIVEGAERQ
jgi:hemerythrin-like domain-containing protein